MARCVSVERPTDLRSIVVSEIMLSLSRCVLATRETKLFFNLDTNLICRFDNR